MVASYPQVMQQLSQGNSEKARYSQVTVIHSHGLEHFRLGLGTRSTRIGIAIDSDWDCVGLGLGVRWANRCIRLAIDCGQPWRRGCRSSAFAVLATKRGLLRLSGSSSGRTRARKPGWRLSPWQAQRQTMHARRRQTRGERVWRGWGSQRVGIADDVNSSALNILS